jgi:hypothetical protein
VDRQRSALARRLLGHADAVAAGNCALGNSSVIGFVDKAEIERHRTDSQKRRGRERPCGSPALPSLPGVNLPIEGLPTASARSRHLTIDPTTHELFCADTWHLTMRCRKGSWSRRSNVNRGPAVGDAHRARRPARCGGPDGRGVPGEESDLPRLNTDGLERRGLPQCQSGWIGNGWSGCVSDTMSVSSWTKDRRCRPMTCPTYGPPPLST